MSVYDRISTCQIRVLDFHFLICLLSNLFISCFVFSLVINNLHQVDRYDINLPQCIERNNKKIAVVFIIVASHRTMFILKKIRWLTRKREKCNPGVMWCGLWICGCLLNVLIYTEYTKINKLVKRRKCLLYTIDLSISISRKDSTAQ